jgi:transcriptional regulator with XRE-family HTH domain
MGESLHSAEKDAPTSDRIAANLRAAIKAAGLTQAEVAERVDMDPTALSKVLSGKRNVSSLELALICTATGSDVLGILGADPLHGPSYRQGYQEAIVHMRRAQERGDFEQVFMPKADPDGDYNGCGTKHPEVDAYCDLPTHAWPSTHHADLFWESGRFDNATGTYVLPPAEGRA